ncbi:gentisate 1,2-dioxygenase [Tistrella bauzanensis]|uniref:Gentisate 1,2-dioxygenase n=1 Tax=Tistrella bauzanensis TaxID=657419 RepID=A0ABQ1IDA0_9PROT|nr:cupin domain-containing protein [Tistrella bauzanensis]GGB35828.1 gentisate 1,2-dioxygenase [Tistrella bauzanensis]
MSTSTPASPARPPAADGLPADYAREIDRLDMAPLWTVLSNLVPEHPTPKTVPHVWPYAMVREALLESGRLISAEKAERRVLVLENPGHRGEHRATASIYAGLQLILPGERAPEHRHTQSALRFVIESDGAYTSVEGARIDMAPFDLVLTPRWRWHAHGHDGQQPGVWLDGLDIPMISLFQSGFAERIGDNEAPVRRPDISPAMHGAGLRPATGTPAAGFGLMHYPFAIWRPALDAARAGGHDPHEGVRLEFTDPASGGPVLPTLSAFAQLIAAGTTTRSIRRTESAIVVGVEGQGRLVVGTATGAPVTITIGPRDVAVVPPWAPLQIHADDGTDLVLFSLSDRAAQAALGLYREDRS